MQKSIGRARPPRLDFSLQCPGYGSTWMIVVLDNLAVEAVEILSNQRSLVQAADSKSNLRWLQVLDLNLHARAKANDRRQ